VSAAPGRFDTTVIAPAAPHAEGGRRGLCRWGQRTRSQQRLADRVGEGNKGEEVKERMRKRVRESLREREGVEQIIVLIWTVIS
jgi:hypothetical protein